jgi:hypothetical protein
MPDADLIALLWKAADALDEEAAWIVDVDVDDRGRSKPSIPRADQPYFQAVTETAQSIRDLVELIRARRRFV